MFRQKTSADKIACAMAGLADVARFCKKYGTSATWHPHQGPNRAQRRAMKYGPAARKHARLMQQKVAFT